MTYSAGQGSEALANERGAPDGSGAPRVVPSDRRANYRRASLAGVSAASASADPSTRRIRPRAASDIGDLAAASKLLGHTEQQITRKVYRRVGETVKPTK